MGKGFNGIFIGVMVFLFISGCKTSPAEPDVEPDRVQGFETLMPLTMRILQRVSNSYEDNEAIKANMNKFQLLNSMRITLEYESITQNDGFESGGRVKFENIRTREVLTIQDQTDGQVIDFKDIDDEIILSVCFEEEYNHTLEFSGDKNDLEGYFYLKIDENVGTPLVGEEKGEIVYGGVKYKVKYGDKKPYLLIKLSQKDFDKINPRILRGRKVE